MRQILNPMLQQLIVHMFTKFEDSIALIIRSEKTVTKNHKKCYRILIESHFFKAGYRYMIAFRW